MTRLLLLFALFAALPASGQTTGKIAGAVRDASGEPLIGVNIRLGDTGRGAITDIDGEYFLIGVPAGTYDLVASYIGFQTQRVEGVRVTVDRTTEVDFTLREEALTLGDGEEVVITASRTLVEADRTSSSAKIDGDAILDLPASNVQDVVALQAGVTRGLDGALHIRGGRASEVKYYVDGVAVSNPFTNSLAAPVENSAVQEVEVISGTFNAEYGQANSGIVNIVTRSGSDDFKGTFIGSVGGYVSNRTSVYPDIDEASLAGERYVEGSLSGPTGIPGLYFFANGTYTDRDGWLYGRNVFVPTDSSSFRGATGRDWFIQASGDSSVVSMNGSEASTVLGKLTFTGIRGVRVNLSATRFDSESQPYGHAFRLNPQSRPTQHSQSTNLLLTLNHILTDRLFYDLRLTSYTTNFRQSVFEDPLDPGYAASYRPASQEPAFVFSTGGLDAYWTQRESRTLAARFDVTSQINDYNLVKAGIEYRRNTLDFAEYLLDVNPVQYGDLLPRIPDVSTRRNNQYERTPVEFAAYIQDKIEYRDLIVNVGLRYDRFDAGGEVPVDFGDPQNVLGREVAYRETEAKSQLSPRLGFAFPITETGVVHASYGQFFQIPEFGRLYENPEFEVQGLNLTGFIGNADIDPQRTTQYEIGLQQQLGRAFVVDVTAYYRDLRNLIGTAFYQTSVGSDTYGRYENVDFGNVRGITLSLGYRLPNLSGSVNYTYQSARGNGSDPRQAFFDRQAGAAAQRVLIPLDWDQQHNVAANMTTEVEGFLVSFIGTYLSGYPFTPIDERRNAIVELRNTARYSPEVRLDVRLSRIVRLAGVRGQVFVTGENLLDSYRPDRLPQLPQREIAARREAGLDRINTLDAFLSNPALQPRPRQLQIGLQFDF
jgi:outer membrane receptor protein involved in Fe transport